MNLNSQLGFAIVFHGLLIGLLSVGLSLSANGSVVPFQGELRPEIDRTWKDLQRAYKTDPRQACRFAYVLDQQCQGSEKAVKAWAIVTYANLLLENDSVVKAESLLMDSVEVNWNEAAPWLRAYHSLAVSVWNAYNGMYSEADDLLRTAFEHTTGNNSLLNVHLLQTLADNLRLEGKLDQSVVKWYEALRMSEQLADSSEIADSYGGRGTTRFQQQLLDKAEEDLKIFYRYHVRSGNRKKMAHGLSMLGLLEYQKGDFRSSIEHSLKSYSVRKDIGDLKGQGESLNNLALGYMGLSSWGQALRYLEEAVQLKTRANDHTQMTVILNNLGHCHKNLENREEALSYYQLALEKGKANGQMGDVLLSYGNIMKLYTETGDYRSAFDIQTKMTTLKDSMNATERDEAIHELEVRYETEKKEQAITLLQQERTIITNRWLTLALGLFLAIIFGTLFLDNQKRKHRQEKQLLVTEDELQKAELKIMSDLLEYNQKKLSLYTENLLKKNELVGQLEQRLKETVEGQSDFSEESKKLIEDFSSIRILTDDDWAEFKALFNSVHQGLLERLLASYENLTLAEQRLFLLMKLHLSTNEIANILGVSPESVKKGRYRLKKKIGVGDTTSLQEFVTSFI